MSDAGSPVASGGPAARGEDPAWAVRDAPESSVRVAPAPATLTALAVAVLLATVLTGRVQLVAFAAPLAVAGVASLLRTCPDRLDVGVSVDRLTTIEGDPVGVSISVASDQPVDRLELVLDVDGALGTGVDGAAAVSRAVRVAAGSPTLVDIDLACERWGVGTIRAVVLRWRDPAGVVTRVARVRVRAVVRILPSSQTLRTLVRTQVTQLASGNAVSRAVGDGIELGDVRPYATGDRLRAINWRVSARHDGLWVTERHLERNVDVVLAVDAVVPGALLRAVRAAAALADAHLAERDRVGLMGMGGVIRWLRPGGGSIQHHRIVNELISAHGVAVETWVHGFSVPRHGLPPGALVIALTSLLDDRSAGVLIDLRNRGFAMAVIEVDAPAPVPASATDHAADRLWRLRRAGRRDVLRARGVPVARWHESDPLESAMAEIAAYRRALLRPIS